MLRIHFTFAIRIGSESGFVYLLFSYVTAVAMAILSAVLLVRSSQELQSTQRSIEMQQAFWNAEGGLDDALKLLRTSPGTLQPGIDFCTAKSCYNYAIETVGSELIPPDTERLTKQITVTGDVNGTTQTIQATYGEEKKFAGVGTGGFISISNDFSNGMLYPPLTPDKFLKVNGAVRSNWGANGSMMIYEVSFQGPVMVGEPGLGQYAYGNKVPYTTLVGVGLLDVSSLVTTAGIAVTKNLSMAIFSAIDPPGATPLSIRPWADPTLDPLVPPAPGTRTWTNACAGGVTVSAGSVRTITDGDACDLTPAGDGKVLLATKFIYLADGTRVKNGGQLKFTAPATVYLIGHRVENPDGTIPGNSALAMTYLQLMGSCGSNCGSGAYYQGPNGTLLQAVVGGSPLIDGVRLVIPQWVYDQRKLLDWKYYTTKFSEDMKYYTDFEIYGGQFAGSIWAPYSDVSVHVLPGLDPPLKPSRMVAKHIGFFGDQTNNTYLTFQNSAGPLAAQPISLTSWTSE